MWSTFWRLQILGRINNMVLWCFLCLYDVYIYTYLCGFGNPYNRLRERNVLNLRMSSKIGPPSTIPQTHRSCVRCPFRWEKHAIIRSHLAPALPSSRVLLGTECILFHAPHTRRKELCVRVCVYVHVCCVFTRQKVVAYRTA